jgi:hypothetical protein
MTQPFDPWRPQQAHGQQYEPQRPGPQGYGQPWQPAEYDQHAHQQRIGLSPPAQQPAWQYPGAHRASALPRKRRRIFIWVFLAIQAIFLIWIIGGAASTSNSGTQAHNQAVSYCRTNWQGLYNSYADCVTSYGNTLNAASDTGKGIGIGLVIGLWVASDVILGVSYGVYRLASRGNR